MSSMVYRHPDGSYHRVKAGVKFHDLVAALKAQGLRLNAKQLEPGVYQAELIR